MKKTFILTICGDDGVVDVNFCLLFMKKWVKDPICVIASRVTLPIEHDWVIHADTPKHLNNLQTSRYLKTGIQKLIRIEEGTIYCYLDNDVFFLTKNFLKVFDLFKGPVLFGQDHKVTVNSFSAWCLNYGKLHEAIEKYFSIQVNKDWRTWNSGLYLFDHNAVNFLNTWHDMVCATFVLPQWIVKDQGPLVAAVWKHGLQDMIIMPPEYNWLFRLSEFDKGKCEYTSKGFFCAGKEIDVIHFFGGDKSKINVAWLHAFEYVFGKNSPEYWKAKRHSLKRKIATLFKSNSNQN